MSSYIFYLATLGHPWTTVDRIFTKDFLIHQNYPQEVYHRYPITANPSSQGENYNISSQSTVVAYPASVGATSASYWDFLLPRCEDDCRDFEQIFSILLHSRNNFLIFLDVLNEFLDGGENISVDNLTFYIVDLCTGQKLQ